MHCHNLLAKICLHKKISTIFFLTLQITTYSEQCSFLCWTKIIKFGSLVSSSSLQVSFTGSSADVRRYFAGSGKQLGPPAHHWPLVYTWPLLFLPTTLCLSDSILPVWTFMSNDPLHWWFPPEAPISQGKGPVGQQWDKLALGSNYTGLVSWLSSCRLRSLQNKPDTLRRRQNTKDSHSPRAFRSSLFKLAQHLVWWGGRAPPAA